MNRQIKKQLSRFIDYSLLLIRHPNDYLNYYKSYRSIIYKALRKMGVQRIKTFNRSQWKLFYKTCYFSGKYSIEGEMKRVFIKVNGIPLTDCYHNEIVVNNHIKANSQYLFERTPAIILHQLVGDLRIIVYEYVNLSPVIVNKEFLTDLQRTLAEYKRVGILHTDFGLVNMGIGNRKHYFFDYGTALCETSNRIRIRKNSDYNHIDKAPAEALALLPDADFYYDDIVHLNMDGISLNDMNFCVSNDTIAYAKLGDDIIKYRLENNKLIRFEEC